MTVAPDTAEADVVRAGAPAATFRGKWAFWAPVLPLALIDIASKYAVFGWLRERFPGHPDSTRRVDFDFLPEPFGFALVDWTNTGTIWGLAQSATYPLMVIRVAALIALAWFARRTAADRKLQLFVLALIAAGAIGNLYDNLFMADRAVRDFLLFYRVGESGREHYFPAFNFADSCICVGAFSLAILMWREDRRESRKRKAQA